MIGFRHALATTTAVAALLVAGTLFYGGLRIMLDPAYLLAYNYGGVLFHAAVTDAVGNIVKQTSTDPPKFLVKLIFSFKGVNEVEVPAERIKG